MTKKSLSRLKHSKTDFLFFMTLLISKDRLGGFFMFCGDILTFLDNWQYFCHFKSE